MIVVVGGGVVGLTSACAIARAGRDVALLERHPRLGTETSTHNSGVIHGALYHPAETLKTRLCMEGRERLYRFCETNRVTHRRCGKLVVASETAEERELDTLAANARANGADVEIVDRAFVAAREPHVRATRALWSPRTGWVDADGYVRALRAEADSLGVAVLPGSPLVGVEPRADGLTIVTPHERIEAEALVNAAGLGADEVSALAGGEAFRIHPCRGEYTELRPRASHLVNGLVYPVPHASGHGLGVHLTKSAAGAVWIGPTIHYQDRKDDYEDDRLPLESFVEPTRQILPAVTIDDLQLGGSGIRAKLHPPSERFADFMIRWDAKNPRVFQVAGIDSPGLTASLAIGEMVAAAIQSAM